MDRLDRLAAEISALSVSSGQQPVPIPLFLASEVAGTISRFVNAYGGDVEDHIRRRQLETDWLTGIEEFHPEKD